MLIVSRENRLAENFGDSTPLVCSDADTALHVLVEREIALLLIEMNVQGDIEALIRHSLEVDLHTQILLFADAAEFPKALRCLEDGAAQILSRPCDNLHLKVTLERASALWRQRREGLHRSQAPDTELPGSSPLTVALRERVLKLSTHDATVLISGEAGVGKTRLARFIHANSLRAQENFVTLDCATLSPLEIEVALFGVENSGKIGALGAAAAGTLYLHDVDRLPGKAQEQLVKAMKEKDFFRVGGKRLWRSDVRVISSTRVQLRDLVHQSRFREELYWELCGVALEVPALRERPADIEELLAIFLSSASRKLGKQTPAIPIELMEKIKAHPFPGNVAELKNLAGLIASLSEGGEADLTSLPSRLLAPIPAGRNFPMGSLALKPVVHAFEKQYLLRVLKAVNGNQSKASRVMDIHRNTLILKMLELGIPNKRKVKRSKSA
jgi:two-component system NtrC family response regulator/two-component system response regulator PilR (NtrC family)